MAESRPPGAGKFRLEGKPPEDESQLGVPPLPIPFQFVDLTTRSKEGQARNRRIARSHVSKLVRRSQGKKRGESSAAPGQPQTAPEDPLPIQNMVHRFYQHSTWVRNSAPFAEHLAVESSIVALQSYKGKVTPYLHELLVPMGKVIWNQFWPPEEDGFSPLFSDWFYYVCSDPATFHVSCYVAATYLDLQNGTPFYSATPEIQMHKIEAIRLINKELEKGVEVPEIIIYAIQCLIEDAREITKRIMETAQPANFTAFKPPFVLMDWQRVTGGIIFEPAHMAGSKLIIRMKGGVEQLQNRLVAFCASYGHLSEASRNILKPPELGFYAIPEALRRAADPSINALPSTIDLSHAGSGFVGLTSYGLTPDMIAVLIETAQFGILIETQLQGRMINPAEWALRARRDQLHHKVLSLPRGETDSFYECCRWTAVLFSTSLLFPMPSSLGVAATLIKEIRRCVENTSLRVILGTGPRRFFIWVLILGGIAAEGLPDRPWFEEVLNTLLAVEGTSKWIELKEIVESFLWMESCCDNGAMNLWDNVAAELRATRKANQA